MSRERALALQSFLTSLDPAVRPDDRWITRYLSHSTSDANRREMVLVYRLLNVRILDADRDWTTALEI